MAVGVNLGNRIVCIDDVRYRVDPKRGGSYRAVRESDDTIVAEFFWLRTDAPAPELFVETQGGAISRDLARQIGEKAKASGIV
jgi:hypothetical protein